MKNYQFNVGDNISLRFSKEDINHHDEKSGYKPTYEDPISSLRICIGIFLWLANIIAIFIALAGINVFGWKRESIIAKLVVIGIWGCFVWLEVYLFIRVAINHFC